MRSQAVREEGFLSTLPARGATIVSGAPPDEEDISIHAPREGSDLCDFVGFVRWGISIHAPREGSDAGQGLGVVGVAISIHAPREGSDMAAFADAIRGGVFLSTLPARGATRPERQADALRRISIHAPREGSDCPSGSRASSKSYFYPRSPRGERPPT